MSANTSPDLSIVGGTSASNNGSPFSSLQQAISCSTASRGNCFSQFTGLSSGSSSFSPTTPSAMSAAAAAAFLLRTAANGSVNGDGSSNSSLPTRRCSTTSLFESPQASPSFPSSVISVAQQAALAAAQAISTNSSPNSKASSDLQAAVLSLALAANPNTSLQSDSNKYTQSDRQNRPSQTVTDLFFLPERHPEILTSHPSLASVFRRRSSTVLPTYLSDLSGGDFGLQGGDRLPTSSVGMSLSSSLASALEAMNPQRPATSDLSGSMLPDQSVTTVGSSNPLLPSSFHAGRNRKESETEVDPYRFTSNTVANIASASSEVYGPKHSRHFSPTFDPNLTSMGNPVQTTMGLPLGQDNRSFSRSSAAVNNNYRDSPRSDSTNPAHYSSYPANACGRTPGPLPQPCHSPIPTISHVTDSTPTPGMCQSSSPLSCSSLSNTGTSAVNISPVLLSDGSRVRNQVGSDGLLTSDVKSGFHYGSHLRSDRMREQDIKSEYGSSMGTYQDEPSRKREQRLIKNREAARECRRKKKEYVKCLEARVSLLESQNQELIEELQKVKALCFNELCGLGLNSSTAACAAAVLAAVTSGPGTYSAAGAPTISSMKTSDRVPDVSGHLSDQVSPNHSAISLDNPQGSSTHLDSTIRSHRARRQSILTDTKLPAVSGGSSSSGVPSRSTVYQSVCDSAQSGRSYVHDETEIKPNNRDPNLTSHTPFVNDMPTECASSPNGGTVYDAGAMDTNDPYRAHNHLSLNQSSHLGGSTTSRRIDPSTYRPQQHSPQKTGALLPSYTSCSSTQSASTAATTSTEGSYYHHPHYAAKRAYRTIATTNPDVKPEFTGPKQQQSKEDGSSDSAECRPKSTRHSNPVAGAAVILAAAAAAMATESESSDPRISV